MGSCALNISWTAPDNIAISDIACFMIYIDGMNDHNMTNSNNDTSIYLFYPVSSCASHNVSVSAVDRCGRESSPSSTITVNPKEVCVCVDATRTPAVDNNINSKYIIIQLHNK